MEAIFLILIGAALFSQSWFILGLYSEGRTMGVFVGGLGLLSLATIMFAPMVLTGEDVSPTADHLAEITIMKSLIIVWALYTVAVAAHGLWDFDERPIGFYCAFLGVATLVPFLYFASELQPGGTRYSEGVGLSLSAATLILTSLAGILFFYLAFSFNVLRLVAGWGLLLGGSLVTIIGLAIISTVVT